MERVAKFYKVTKEQFLQDFKSVFSSYDEPQISKIYDDLQLPRRATAGSAGYDFFSPIPFVLRQGETVLIPTGIRVQIDEGYMLQIHPRSGLGFKYRLQLDNTTGIIDSDYYYSDNEGHIFCKMTNDSKQEKSVVIDAHDAFVQGVFIQFAITADDNVTETRNGGFGSTTSAKK